MRGASGYKNFYKCMSSAVCPTRLLIFTNLWTNRQIRRSLRKTKRPRRVNREEKRVKATKKIRSKSS